MKANPLFSRFELIADTPGNVQLLRKLIVYLAISGRLLDSHSNELSIPEILSEIASKRQLLITSGKAKKQRVLPPIDETELPAGCQDKARFERLENIATLEKGLTAIQRSKRGDYPLVTTGEHKSSSDHYDFEGRAAIIPMVSSTGHGSATLKRLHYQEGKFAVGNILCAAFPISDELISARFIFEYLTAFKEELLVSKMIGTANVSLTIGKIGEVPIPIVPPAVQRRVDELMTLCDRFEEALECRERVRDQLVTASLHHLNEAANGQSLRTHTSLYFGHLPRLTTQSHHIEQLRETILNIAVRGQFSAQNLSDEPVSKLLGQIRLEQQRLVSEGAIPKPKPLLPVSQTQLAFDLPPNWESVDFGELCNVVTSGSRGWAEYYSESGAKFIRAQNIRFGKLRLDDLACVNPPKKIEGTRTQVSNGDLLVVITGAGVTNPALLETDLGEAYVSQHVALIKPTDTSLSAWLLLCLMAPMGGRGELVKRAYGAGKPGLNLGNIRSLPIPLPPLAEQRRILAKVSAVMKICDRLETTLAAQKSESGRLLEAVLHLALRTSGTSTSIVNALLSSSSPAALNQSLMT
ncbi:MAG TPA: restriction endonuclease subunit S [Candidatus Acidoferrales bacterium]|nr:restriction endonuclease subunit S [Candidatus Acidoferrales bacterium]